MYDVTKVTCLLFKVIIDCELHYEYIRLLCKMQFSAVNFAAFYLQHCFIRTTPSPSEYISVMQTISKTAMIIAILVLDQRKLTTIFYPWTLDHIFTVMHIWSCNCECQSTTYFAMNYFMLSM